MAENKKTTRRKKPEIARIVQPKRTDALVGAYGGAMTPETLASIHYSADLGDIDQAMRLYSDVISKDLHLASVIETRSGAVVGCEREITPGTDDAQGEKDADLVREVLEAIPDFDTAMMSLLEAAPYGFACPEIMWATDGRWIYIESLDEVLQHRFTFRGPDWELLKQPRLLTEEWGSKSEEIPAEKFLFHRFRPRGGYVVRSGLMRGLVWWWLFKNYSVKDWVSFMEKFGQGFVLGKYDPASSPGDRDVLEIAVKNMATELAAIISKNTEIETREFRGTASLNMFEDFNQFANAEMSKRVLGQTLTTQEGKSGSYALGKVHGDVRQDILEWDARCLMGTVQRGLVEPIVIYNYGPRDKYPKFLIRYQPPADLKALADRDKILVVDMGAPLPLSYVRDTYGIPEPEGDEPVLGGVIPSPQPSPEEKGEKSAEFQEAGEIAGLDALVKSLTIELSEDAIGKILGNVGSRIKAFEGGLLSMVQGRVRGEINGLVRGQISIADATNNLEAFFSSDRFKDPDSGEYTMDPRARAEMYVRNELKQVYRDTALENAKEAYPNQQLYAFSRGPRDARTEDDSRAIEALTNWEYGGTPMPLEQYWAHPTVQASHRPNDRGRDVIWPLLRFPEEVQRMIRARYG